ncbi:hypothetical protein AeRB84_002110 [Aphanomyces euteiches]|nr:hypothetical protein AeRB84_002110 [Aphanomyces euteiches]
MCTNTLSARDCSLAQAAGRGNVVSFVGHDYLPLTNGVGFCDFVYGDSSLNSTCSRGMKSIGPGIKKKDGIMRDHSVQALILVTSTTCINALLKNLAISWCVPLQRQKSPPVTSFILTFKAIPQIAWLCLLVVDPVSASHGFWSVI